MTVPAPKGTAKMADSVLTLQLNATSLATLQHVLAPPNVDRSAHSPKITIKPLHGAEL